MDLYILVCRPSRPAGDAAMPTGARTPRSCGGARRRGDAARAIKGPRGGTTLACTPHAPRPGAVTSLRIACRGHEWVTHMGQAGVCRESDPWAASVERRFPGDPVHGLS